ncbi:hypothetical protein R3P38DRAFT_927491 [Favolaschia claudopus]|uniref:Uncharacterized protein n=1 Tax=Favolaschia claudopus TaxID=2862362 RepID=A0AAW0BP72_9AGAR
MKSSIKALRSTLPIFKAAAAASATQEFSRLWSKEWMTSPQCHRLVTPSGTVSPYLLSCHASQCQRLELIRRLGTARLTLRLLLSAKKDHKRCWTLFAIHVVSRSSATRFPFPFPFSLSLSSTYLSSIVYSHILFLPCHTLIAQSNTNSTPAATPALPPCPLVTSVSYAL